MIDQELLDAYKNDNLILFIGAGVSKTLIFQIGRN